MRNFTEPEAVCIATGSDALCEIILYHENMRKSSFAIRAERKF